MKPWCIALALSLPLFSCNDEAKLTKEFKENLAYYQGVWEAPAYGYLLSISDKGLSVYDHLDDFCIKNKMATQALSLPNIVNKIDANNFTFAQSQYSTSYRFTKSKRPLPKSCLEQSDSNRMNTFDYYSKVLEKYYAFFDLYGVDWQQRVKAARSLISENMSDKELFELFSSMLDGIEDSHLSLTIEENGKEISYEKGEETIIKLRLDEAFAKQSAISDRGEFGYDWYLKHINTITNNILTEQINIEHEDKIIAGIIDDIGYINIFSMGGFADPLDMEQELSEARKTLTKILNKLTDKKAIIIDISANGGGYEELSLLFAGFFANTTQNVYQKHANNFSSQLQTLTIKPEIEAPYQGPVFVLTSDYSVSAAENFAMAMAELPNVKIVGDATRGAFSTILSKRLPNGWKLGLSNEIYSDFNGHSPEGIGVKPDIPLGVFTQGTIYTSHELAIKQLIDIIEN